MQRTGPESAPGTDPGPLEREAELLVKLDRLQAEMTELARKLGTAEGALQAVTGERDRWHALAEALQRQLAERRPGLLARLFRKAG
ncbi:MAG: hypothetical protein M3248_04960 [Actinomycetota bacterium]|nr:hypothetical protein [Actinomycetota bacterium]